MLFITEIYQGVGDGVRNLPGVMLVRSVLMNKANEINVLVDMFPAEHDTTCYLTPHRGRARYCNAHVCLFVCLCVCPCLSVFSQNFKV